MTIAEVWRKSSLYFSVILCTSVFAQAGSLEVTCVNASGEPVSGIKVYTVALGQKKADDEKTNKEGVAVFKKLDDGYYRVFTHEKGYAPAYDEWVQMSGDQQKSVSLTLKPGEDHPLYFENNQKLAEAQQALQQGGAALQNKQFDEAEAQLKKAIEDNPAEPAAYFSLGMLYVQQNKYDEAKAMLTKAVGLFKMYQSVQGSSNPAIGEQLQQAETQLQFLPVRSLAAKVDEATKAKDYDTALKYLAELQKLRPDDARIYYTMAYMLAQTRHIDEALTKIDKAIELKPDEQDFQNLKKQLVDIQKQQAAQKEANAARSKVAEVQQLNKDGKYEEAIAKAKEVLPETPEKLKPILWAEITNANIRLKNYAEAADAYQKDLELNKKPVAEGLYKLGEQFVHKGQQDAASAVFEKVLEVDPNYAEAYYQLGMYYFYEKQNKDKAKQLLDKYLSIGKNKDNLSNAKNVLVVMGKEKG
jgi:tetratricopeptide (TPR) repeat protein